MPALHHVPLNQIRAIIAVCEEGSFTRAATRENATQSGISQHVGKLEQMLGVKLFDRSAGGATPTPAGLRYYKRCVEAVSILSDAVEDARMRAGELAGSLRVGLMPTFTRAVLSTVLEDYVAAHPNVRPHIVEGYSGLLTEMVLEGSLDFAVVPAFGGMVGLKSQLLVRDREMLISGPRSKLPPLKPLRLAELKPLRIVVPGPDNVRRRNLEAYFHTHDVKIAAMLEMDAMIATLDFVARTDWVTILPSLISVNDIGGKDLIINPIDRPAMHAEFVVIQPARQSLSGPARAFLTRLEREVASIQSVWKSALANPSRHARVRRRKS